MEMPEVKSAIVDLVGIVATQVEPVLDVDDEPHAAVRLAIYQFVALDKFPQIGSPCEAPAGVARAFEIAGVSLGGIAMLVGFDLRERIVLGPCQSFDVGGIQFGGGFVAFHGE